MNVSVISKLFSTLESLEILDLGENHAPKDPMVLLAMISRLKKLKQLNLDITRLYHLPKGVFLHFFPNNTSFSKYLKCRKTPFGR
jgi:hypothetical protein